MRILLILFISFSFFDPVFSQQKVQAEIIGPEEVKELFTDSVLQTLKITFPIFRVYKYRDKSGLYYCILTENRNDPDADNDTLITKIRAVNVKQTNTSLVKTWEINDHINNSNNRETSIWFWTKYIEFTDYDGDGAAEPIIIYGSSALNGYDDGRVKLIMYYNGQKTSIRHQNAVLDHERSTQVDKSYYTLPISLQKAIKQKIELLIKNQQVIFPAGWEKAMKNKKEKINEQ